MTNETTATTQYMTDATNFINSNKTINEITAHLAYQYELVQAARESRITATNRLNALIEQVTEFIKDNMSDGADSDALKELANELDIELTKDLRITLTVQYYADVTVPLDYDVENIDESDFDINIRYTGSDDVDFSDESTEVDEFDVREA